MASQSRLAVGRPGFGVDNRQPLHLNECLDVPQPGDLDGGHRGVGRAHQSAPYVTQLAPAGLVPLHVHDVDREGGELVGPATGGFEGSQQVAERLLELHHDVTLDEVTRSVERGLPSEVNGSTVGHDRMREAPRGWQ